MKNIRLDREDTVLVLVDFQEKLMPSRKDGDKVISATVKMIEGAKVFGIPVITTQQYTKGLGATVEPVAEALGCDEHIEKKEFSCYANPDFRNALDGLGKKTVLIAGCETHVCVEQTVFDLLEAGYNVMVLGNCVSSRFKNDRKTALQLMQSAGASVTTYEAALFDLLGSADDPVFREISKIVK